MFRPTALRYLHTVLPLLLGAVIAVSTAHAAPPSHPTPPLNHNAPLENDGISGTVMDHTITAVGHRFYQAFSGAWLNETDLSQVNLAIYERPSARWGSLIWIEYRRTTVFRTFVSPARLDLQRLAQQAVKIVAARIRRQRLENLLMRDPDLGRSDL